MACRAVLKLEHSSSAKTLRGQRWRPITIYCLSPEANSFEIEDRWRL
jgi:hypothetical protein